MIRAPGRDGSCKANTGQGNSGATRAVQLCVTCHQQCDGRDSWNSARILGSSAVSPLTSNRARRILARVHLEGESASRTYALRSRNGLLGSEGRDCERMVADSSHNPVVSKYAVLGVERKSPYLPSFAR